MRRLFTMLGATTAVVVALLLTNVALTVDVDALWVWLPAALGVWVASGMAVVLIWAAVREDPEPRPVLLASRMDPAEQARWDAMLADLDRDLGVVQMQPPPCADHERNELNCPVCTAQRRAFYAAMGSDGGES